MTTQIRDLAERHARIKEYKPDLAIQLFGGQGSVSERDIERLYTATYEEAVKQEAKPELIQLLSIAGWIAFLALLVKQFAIKLIERAMDGAVAAVLKQFQPLSPFRAYAWKKYLSVEARRLDELRLPFFTEADVSLLDHYIPVSIRLADKSLLAGSKLLATHAKFVILGQPGSGKSLLLRYLAITYSADTRPLRAGPSIPVFVELHLANASATLVDYVSGYLIDHGVNCPSDEVRKLIQSGSVTLLLDGLDEVNPDKRGAFTLEIAGFLAMQGARVIVTCRTEAYTGEFNKAGVAVGEVAELVDSQVSSLLSKWAGKFPPSKSVDHLIQVLRDRPRIFALMRNPLLLTLVAFLYVENEEYTLPHSRTEFYRQATDELLQKWKKKTNSYLPQDKRLVLQQLALHNHLKSNEIGKSRRMIPVSEALSITQETLRKIGSTDPKEAEKVLTEIVERSGILLTTNLKDGYQFAHLTLQEFFVANELQQDPERLYGLYRENPMIWRESLKLWCGLDCDATEIVSRLAAQEPSMAIECLSESSRVAEEVAAQIFVAARSVALTGNISRHVAEAVASLASTRRQQGRTLFSFLQEYVTRGDPQSESFKSVCTCLSLTNMPAAANLLCDLYVRKCAVEEDIVRMGDLAVEPLTAVAQAGDARPVALIARIATPGAGAGLAKLTWSNNPEVRADAAWSLASLLGKVELSAVVSRLSDSAPEEPKGQFEPILDMLNLRSRSGCSVIRRLFAVLYTHDIPQLGPHNYPVAPWVALSILCTQSKEDPDHNQFVNIQHLRRDLVQSIHDRIEARRGIPNQGSIDDGQVEDHDVIAGTSLGVAPKVQRYTGPVQLEDVPGTFYGIGASILGKRWSNQSPLYDSKWEDFCAAGRLTIARRWKRAAMFFSLNDSDSALLLRNSLSMRHPRLVDLVSKHRRWSGGRLSVLALWLLRVGHVTITFSTIYICLEVFLSMNDSVIAGVSLLVGVPLVFMVFPAWFFGVDIFEPLSRGLLSLSFNPWRAIMAERRREQDLYAASDPNGASIDASQLSFGYWWFFCGLFALLPLPYIAGRLPALLPIAACSLLLWALCGVVDARARKLDENPIRELRSLLSRAGVEG